VVTHEDAGPFSKLLKARKAEGIVVIDEDDDPDALPQNKKATSLTKQKTYYFMDRKGILI
jgi:hypothetical protein